MICYKLSSLSGSGLPVVIRDTEQNRSCDFHSHDYVELALVHSGNGVHLLQRQDTTLSNAILKGDVFTILPGEIHAYQNLQHFRIYNLCIGVDYLQSLGEELSLMTHYAAFFRPERQVCGQRLHLPPAVFQQAEGLVRQLIDALTSRHSTRVWAVRIILQHLLLTIFDQEGRVATITPSEGMMDIRFFQSIERLEQHPERPLILQEESRKAGMSLSSYAHKFRQATGLSPKEYVTYLRLEKARRLLEETDQSLTEIALSCGFCDSNYLSRQFRKRYGTTPFRHRSMLRSFLFTN